MEKELNILRSKEDGSLTLGYDGIDFKDYDCITVEEFIDIVDGLNSWDMIEPEIYEKALDDVGLNYNDYDDPDIMWNDFLQKIKKMEG